MFNISVKARDGRLGEFIAACPELSVSCQGQTEEEALSKLQSLICFHVTSREDILPVAGQIPEGLPVPNSVKILYVPDKLREH